MVELGRPGGRHFIPLADCPVGVLEYTDRAVALNFILPEDEEYDKEQSFDLTISTKF